MSHIYMGISGNTFVKKMVPGLAREEKIVFMLEGMGRIFQLRGTESTEAVQAGRRVGRRSGFSKE